MKLLVLLTVGLLLNCQRPADDKIVLINIGNLSRLEIARCIGTVKELHPRVMALDVQFDGSQPHQGDQELFEVLEDCPNLVQPSMISYIGDGKHSVYYNGGQVFTALVSETGFINAILEEDGFETQRKFLLKETNTANDKVEYHFSVKTAMLYDSILTQKFLRHNSGVIEIDFTRKSNQFRVLQAQDIIESAIASQDVKDKIVMIGFLGPGEEDKFYTPLNDRSKSSKPDMYGMEILANIVYQILESEE